MQIVGQSPSPTTWDFVLLGIFTLAALLILWRTGVFHRDSVMGSPISVDNVTTRAILMLLLAAFSLWMLILFGFQAFLQVNQKVAGQPVDPAQMTPANWAFISVVPGLAVTILLIFGHLLGKRGGAGELGFAPRQFPRGMIYGLIGFVVVLPLVNWTLLLLSWFYDLVHIEHPNEHELLRILGGSSSTGEKIAIIIGATLVAPISEEFIFRGHLQSLLVRLFTRKTRLAGGFAIETTPASPVEPLMVIERRASPQFYWLAIVVTSFLFAAIHAPWMAPAIFVLSICIGYIYQRTGNLWAAIVVHALFNIVNTAQFLLHSGT